MPRQRTLGDVGSRRSVSARTEARRRRRLRRRRLLGLAAALAVVIALAVLALTVLAGPDTHGARLVRYSIDSRLVGHALPQVGVVPPGAAHGRRALLVFLHSKGGEEESNLNGELFAALARLGARAPDIVFPNGGEDSYWHNRADGETAAGAFDNAEDLERHDVLGAAEAANPYPGKPLWLDVGTEDPFRSADTELALELREKGDAVHFHVWPGAHEGSYWRSHWDDYLGFYASALARC